MTVRDALLRVRALIAPRRVERELDEELSFHIERETQHQMANGSSPADARARALARFGSVALAADQCRDERGTAFVDGCVRDVQYAIRMVRRAPLAAATIVTTVALGLGLVTVVFTFFNVLMFRPDAVLNPDELYAVRRPRAPGADAAVPLTRQDYEAVRREAGIFSDTYAALPDIDSRIDGRMMGGTLVTGNFFQVLGVPALLGRTLTPADDERGAPRPVVVLSHQGWSLLYAGDPGVIGRRLLVNSVPYEIVGVMPEGFRGLAVGAPDYWAPLSLLDQFRPIHAGRADQVGIEIIGRLKPGLSRQTALAGLTVWDATRTTTPQAVDRQPRLTLEPRRGTLPDPAEAIVGFTPLFFAFGLILLIGCANVANMLIARGIARQREFGVRLSLGAGRGRIIRQLLTESLLLALVSAALAFAVSRLVLEATIAAAMRTMPPEFVDTVRLAAPDADWRVLVFLVAGAVVSTVFFGLAPALQATRIEPVRSMRGEVTRDARPRRARNALIGVQVAASALLLICSGVFLRSALASSMLDPGVRTADTVLIDIVNESFRTAMVQAVSAEPYVAAMAASRPDALSSPREGFVETPAGRSRVAYRFVSPEYFTVLDIGLVSGRGFTQAERAGQSAVVVVSESIARQLWRDRDAVGQVLQLEADPNSDTRRIDEPPLPARTFTVVGVARDVAGFRLAGYSEANVYLATSAEAADASLTVRVHGDPDQARHALVQRLTSIDPNMGQVVTMRTLARMETYFLQIAFWSTLVLGTLALILTVSGLFSVLSYVVAQRTKEIGVRMALGATAQSLAALVLSQSFRPVTVGLLTGGGLAAGLAGVLMTTPAAATIEGVVQVFDPVAYAASLLIIVGACVLAAAIPALRAARVDPIAALRQD